ncbi:DUF2969 family protein [uncultured Enterococcus sp.]|uniref:DUF2969 family protein n=1 Tax=uncultured Enterococcus sp. TaxID=167972 RepID=UPI0025E69217|nr:DUF2969 family protein [uncultured Enterococcus sp.]
MKKNKETEIRMEESTKVIQGNTYEVATLMLGKKTIGEILVYAPKEFQVFVREEHIGSAKTMDDAVELFIRQWNLQE